MDSHQCGRIYFERLESETKSWMRQKILFDRTIDIANESLKKFRLDKQQIVLIGNILVDEVSKMNEEIYDVGDFLEHRLI